MSSDYLIQVIPTVIRHVLLMNWDQITTLVMLLYAYVRLTADGVVLADKRDNSFFAYG